MHVCSSVSLSFHLEHVSVTGCLSLALHAGRRWQQSILHVAVAAWEPLGQWSFGQGSSLPSWAGYFLLSAGLVGVPLASVITHYMEAVAQVDVATGFSWARTYP